MVPLPTFLGSYCYLSQQLNEISHFEHHYAALTALRRICRAFHDAISQGEIAEETKTLITLPKLTQVQ